MRMITIFVMIVFIISLLGGCGMTVKENHVFQVKDSMGRVNYYKVEICSRATNAKAEYKSGLYDAEALNSLLGEVNDKESVDFDKDLQRLRRAAFLDRTNKYFDAVKEGKSVDSARQAVYDTLIPLDIREKKYAIINSSLASVVEEAIASFAEEKETEDVMYATVAGVKRTSYIEAKAEQKQLQNMRTRAFTIYSAAKVLKQTGSCTDSRCGDSLKKLFEDTAALKAY